MDYITLSAELRNIAPNMTILENEAMKDHTSFRIGGTVPLMVMPENGEVLAKVLECCEKHGAETLLLGNGSNILANDAPIDRVVIKTKAMDELCLGGTVTIMAGAGVQLSRIANFALDHSLTGFEFAHGIPGTLGAAVAINAGAYGGEMKDVVIETIAMRKDGSTYVVRGEGHGFSYRHSCFSGTGHIVLAALIRLKKGDKAEIKAKMDELSEKRRSSQPLNYPSAGSTFKRPVGGYAAALIDQAGLKGFTVGGAQVSEKHAGFVINRGGASFDDVLAVMEHIKKTVYDTSGIMLEPEVEIVR